MKNKHYYSLIIPCYNEEKTIERVIEKSKPFVNEIIVVNDASNDQTKKLLESQNDIMLINNKITLGQEKSIEIGINKSKGDIIILIDADLEHDPADIPRFKKYFLEKKLDLVIGKRENIPRSGEKRLSSIIEKKYQITDILNGFKIFNRKVYDELGFYYSNDFYGLIFTIEALKKFKVGQIKIKSMKRRKDPRIGNDKEIEKKLQKIISYIEEDIKNEES